MKARFVCSAFLAIAACGVCAQSYPTKPVRLVVGFTPGGGVDINARLLAPKLQEYLGQQIIVDNRPGAGTNIANELVARAAPDGYTLLVNTAAVVINMSLYKKVNFDAIKDFAPISLFSHSPNILTVHPSLPVKGVKDLVALAKAKPGAMNFSSAGAGTTQHLTGELFRLRTGTQIVHVPYKGSAPSLTALLGGEVEMTFANIPAISSHVKAKRLRALANAGAKRSDQLPEVPTMGESGIKGVEVVVWYGVLGPGRNAPRNRDDARRRDRQSGARAGHPAAADRPGRGARRQLSGRVREAAERRAYALGGGSQGLRRERTSAD